MKLACSQVLHMHVYTTSGTHVGKVVDFSIDVETGMLLEYSVKHGLLSSPITIARERIVRIEEDKLIVEDRVWTEEQEKKLKIPFGAPDPVSMREE